MGYKYPSEEGGETDEKEKDKRKSVQYWDRWNEEMEDTVDRYQVVLKRDYNPDTKGIYIIDPPEQYKEISFENITPSRRVRSITIRSFHIEGIELPHRRDLRTGSPEKLARAVGLGHSYQSNSEIRFSTTNRK